LKKKIKIKIKNRERKRKKERKKMEKKCYVPDSIPELQKKNISVNIGRPAKVTARKPTEQILIEKDYQNFLGHLIIQNETLTQLKKEIEYKLKKLKDEEYNLNLLHNKYSNNKEKIDNEEERDEKEEHMKLFRNAQKDWENRKQELINGNYIDVKDKNDLQNLMDNNSLNNEFNFSFSNTLTTDDSTINNLQNLSIYNYADESEKDNNDSTNKFQSEKQFSLSPEFSLSTFNFDNIDNLETLDPNLMNLDIDFDMNLLDIDLPKDNIIENLTESINNKTNENVNSNSDYLDTDIAKIIQEMPSNSIPSLNNNILENSSNISLNELPTLPDISNSETNIEDIINELNPSILPIINDTLIPIQPHEMSSNNNGDSNDNINNSNNNNSDNNKNK